MSKHPLYIQVNGSFYKRAEQIEDLPTTLLGETKNLLALYSQMLHKADPDNALTDVLDMLTLVRSAAKDIEAKLPDSLRPSKWSVMDEFQDTFKQLGITSSKVNRAWKVVNRLKQLQEFAKKRGVHVPTSEQV